MKMNLITEWNSTILLYGNYLYSKRIDKHNSNCEKQKKNKTTEKFYLSYS